MSSRGQRVIAGVALTLFVASLIGGTGAIIWQINKDKERSELESTLQQLQNQQQSKEGKLEGTKLADFTPVARVTELQKIDITPGTGEEVKAGATVTAHYTGAVAKDGTIFQSSHDTGQPIPFGLDQVIKGWTEGVPGMKVGGKRRLLIPAEKAYGANPPQGSNIPPNADLVFDIEVVKIGQ